ncbi:MAG: hypothetical protein WHS82_03140 [Candidatus Methanosuratincola sp.]
MAVNAVILDAKIKKGDLGSAPEGSVPSSSPSTQGAAKQRVGHRTPEIRLAAMTCLIVGFGGFASSAAVALLYLNASLGAVPLLARIVEGFAGRATLFGVGIVGVSLVLVLAGYLLLRRSKTGGVLAMFASTLLLFLPVASLFFPVSIEPFVAGVVIGVILICLVASGWEGLS